MKTDNSDPRGSLAWSEVPAGARDKAVAILSDAMVEMEGHQEYLRRARALDARL